MAADLPPPRNRLPAERRLKLTRDFTRVRTEGRALRGGLLMLGALEVEDEVAFKVGFVTSRRVGRAVVRNRVRRRLREIVRRHQHEVRAGIWMVIVARPAAAGASSAELAEEWMKLARRAGVISL